MAVSTRWGWRGPPHMRRCGGAGAEAELGHNLSGCSEAVADEAAKVGLRNCGWWQCRCWAGAATLPERQW